MTIERDVCAAAQFSETRHRLKDWLNGAKTFCEQSGKKIRNEAREFLLGELHAGRPKPAGDGVRKIGFLVMLAMVFRQLLDKLHSGIVAIGLQKQHRREFFSQMRNSEPRSVKVMQYATKKRDVFPVTRDFVCVADLKGYVRQTLWDLFQRGSNSVRRWFNTTNLGTKALGYLNGERPITTAYVGNFGWARKVSIQHGNHGFGLLAGGVSGRPAIV